MRVIIVFKFPIINSSFIGPLHDYLLGRSMVVLCTSFSVKHGENGPNKKRKWAGQDFMRRGDDNPGIKVEGTSPKTPS
jgi:hypothetical protein